MCSKRAIYKFIMYQSKEEFLGPDKEEVLFNCFN